MEAVVEGVAYTRRATTAMLARALVSGTLVSGGLASCGQDPDPGHLDRPIRIGFQRNGVLLLAKTRGGLDATVKTLAPGVRWVEFPSGPPLMEALGAGAVDLGAVGETPPIFAQAAEAPIVYAAAQPVTGAASALLVRPDSPALSVADVRGKRVAFTKATSAHLFVIEALRRSGMTLADIQPTYLSPGDASGAFLSGAIDAWATWDPYYALAQRNQRARALITGESLPPTSAFIMAARPFAEGSPAALAAVLSGLRSQARWGDEHRADVAGIIAKGTGLPPEIAAATLRRGPFDLRPLDATIIARQQANADIFRDIGAIPKAIDVGHAIWRGWGG